MKKIMLFIVSLWAVTAWAQNDSVKVYGLIDASEYNIKGGSTQITGQSNRAVATSRLGFLANENIGGGLKSGAQLETEVNISNGSIGSTTTGTGLGTFNRAANVFLAQDKYGKLTIGRMATPIYVSMIQADAIGINSLGFANSTGQGHAYSIANAVTGEAARTALTNQVESMPGLFNSGIAYASPRLYGVALNAFTTAGTGTSNTDFLSVGQQDVTLNGKFGKAEASLGQSNLYNTTAGIQSKRTLASVNYTINKVKLTASGWQTRYSNNSNHDFDVWSVGGKYAYTARTTFGLSYTATVDKSNTNNKSGVTGLALLHDLSKRTQVYTLAGFTQNKGASFVNPLWGGPSMAGSAGQNSTLLTAGLKHVF